MFIIFFQGISGDLYKENCGGFCFLNLGIGELLGKDSNCIELDEVAQVSR